MIRRVPRLARAGGAWAADYAWIVRAQAGALRRRDEHAWSDGARAPVVLLPGIWETWPVLVDLGDALHAAGHPVHVVPGLGANGAPVRPSADLVARRIGHLGLRGVVLVAHSKGGLIGKAVLTGPVGDRVVGLVAVNTPFAGSIHATWFPSRQVRALSPRHPDIRELSGVTDRHGDVVSVSVRFDPHVPGGHHLPGATNVRLPVDGHFRALADRRVIAEVTAQVSRLAEAARGG